LTKTKKKDREWKEGLITQVRNAVDRCVFVLQLGCFSSLHCGAVNVCGLLALPPFLSPHHNAPKPPHAVPPHPRSYPNVYVFRFHNMRNEKFKELRDALKDSSRFVMGSNKMLQVALGKTEADEYRTNLHLLSERLHGHVGLFFTSLAREEVRLSLQRRCMLG